MKYKIVDLFAGPGGLGEGFASYKGDASFEIAVSAEMEESAHKTLTLRSFFRHIRGDQKALAAYYDFCHSADAPHPGTKVASAWKDAQAEANKLTLGVPADNDRLDELIVKAGLREEETVLIGGPPCQAYSLVGRSRNKGKEHYVAEDDHRHFLYREYLRILDTTRPAVFVMENVKGILSSKVNGKLVFHDILRDLAEPGKALGRPDGLRYTIHSLVSPVNFKAGMEPDFVDANAFIIEAEKYGIPQARHRVILLGVREELKYDGRYLLSKSEPITVDQTIISLPQLRSKLSKDDSDDRWRSEVHELAKKLQADAEAKGLDQLALRIRGEAIKLGLTLETGALRYHHVKLPEEARGAATDARRQGEQDDAISLQRRLLSMSENGYWRGLLKWSEVASTLTESQRALVSKASTVTGFMRIALEKDWRRLDEIQRISEDAGYREH